MRKLLIVALLVGISGLTFAGTHFDSSKDTGVVHTEGQSSDSTAWATTTSPASGDGVFTPYQPETTVGEDSHGDAWESVSQ